jgi:hypothetical protein
MARPRKPGGALQPFAAHFSPTEHAALRQAAQDYGASRNYIVRVALRAALGMKLPASLSVQPEEQILARQTESEP